MFGALFGSKPAPQTQLASATHEGSGDAATSRTDAKATRIQTVAAAKLNSTKPTASKSDPQQTAAAQPKPGLQQEANAAPPEADYIKVVSALPTLPANSFDSRWHGSENDAPKSEPQQTAAVQPKPGLQQEVNTAPPESDNIDVVSAPVPGDSFDSRWHGFQ